MRSAVTMPLITIIAIGQDEQEEIRVPGLWREI